MFLNNSKDLKICPDSKCDFIFIGCEIGCNLAGSADPSQAADEIADMADKLWHTANYIVIRVNEQWGYNNFVPRCSRHDYYFKD